MKKEKIISKNWIEESGIEGGTTKVNPLEKYTLLKVYNPILWQIPDIEMDWQIVELTNDWWKPFSKTLSKVKVLDLTKSYKGYATKMTENWPVKDENWNTVKELYYTPEVSVYDKSNIAIAKNTENWPIILGKGWFQSYLWFTTSMKLEDGTINPLFSTIGTNSQTWEKYPISIMKQEYSMYFEIESKLYKIRLWSSYGRWKDVQEGTFLHSKEVWMKVFKEEYPTMRFEFHYLTLDATIAKTDKYKYLNWKFNSITEESVMEQLTLTKEAIANLNSLNFPGLNINDWMESLPFNMNRLILSTAEKVVDIIDSKKEEEEWEISLDNLPF